MKKKRIVLIAVIAFIVLCVIALLVCMIIKHYNNQRNIDMYEYDKEKVEAKFKEIMGIDLPDGLTPDYYSFYYSFDDHQTGEYLMHFVFEPGSYDSVFQHLQENIVEKRSGIIIYQNKQIYDPNDYDSVLDFNSYPIRALKNMPYDLSIDLEEPIEYIVGYEMVSNMAKKRLEFGVTFWLIFQDGLGMYHLSIDDLVSSTEA